jgi:hypothetical protein
MRSRKEFLRRIGEYVRRWNPWVLGGVRDVLVGNAFIWPVGVNVSRRFELAVVTGQIPRPLPVPRILRLIPSSPPRKTHGSKKIAFAPLGASFQIRQGSGTST